MLRALQRTVSQLLDPAIFGVLVMSVLGAGVVLLAIWSGVGAFVVHMTFSTKGWIDWLARLVIGVGAVFATLALFGAIAALIAGFFAERVACAVERRYYPRLPPSRPQSMAEQLGGGVSFLLTVILVNLLALPLYLIWGADIPVFVLVNGYLLGRAYFDLVALRRVDRRTARALWQTHRLKLMGCGALIVAFSFVPFANLLTPVVATAFMLHIFQGFPEFEEACEGKHFGDTPSIPFHRP